MLCDLWIGLNDDCVKTANVDGLIINLKVACICIFYKDFILFIHNFPVHIFKFFWAYREIGNMKTTKDSYVHYQDTFKYPYYK